MQIRTATPADIPFLITAISEAEKSGTDILSYQRIFGLNDDQWQNLLLNILEEDMLGQELCVSGFLIAEEEEKPLAAVCAWVEGVDDMPSGVIKGNLLAYFLPEENMTYATENLKTLEGFNVHRAMGALQLESIYTAPESRGKGITGQLIAQHIRNHPEIKVVQITLMGDNASALRAYEKLGFRVVESKTAENAAVKNLMPGMTKILMQKEL